MVYLDLDKAVGDSYTVVLDNILTDVIQPEYERHFIERGLQAKLRRELDSLAPENNLRRIKLKKHLVLADRIMYDCVIV